MARDDASGRGNSGHGENDPWDFDLPDLGESTRPARNRTARTPQHDAAAEPPYDLHEQSWAASADDHHRVDDDWDTPADDAYGAGGGSSSSGGGLGPEVYRRRRLIALVVAIAVVGALAYGLVNLLGGDAEVAPGPAATAQPTNTDPFAGFTARPESQASDGASGPAARACGEKLKVSASTEKETYGEDENPILVMSLENTGDDACMVNAGTARMNFAVTSGPDKVFDSAHCQIDGQDRPIELEPGETESARFEWNRHRSVADCATEGAQVNPGGYRLTVALGETRSEGVEFTLE